MKSEHKPSLDALNDLVRLIEKAKERNSERIEFTADRGIYERVELHTPDGGPFLVGPAYLWQRGLTRDRRNVDLRIRRVPEHLRDDGLGECELTIYSDKGVPLLSGEIKDDGNRQDGLGIICIAVLLDRRPNGD